VGVHLLVEHAFQLEAPDALLERLGIRLDGARSPFVVLGFGELEQLCGVRNSLAGLIDLLYRGGKPRALASQLLCPLLVGPDSRVFQLSGDFLEPLFLLVVLKETPEGTRCAPRDPSAGA
jgi:hypothetical protein